MSDNEITVSKKPKKSDIEKPLTIDDLIYVISAGNADTKMKRVFLKTIKYKGDIKKAMTEENYSRSMIDNPKKIIKSKTWESLIDKYFPKDALLKKEKELWKQKDWHAWANSLDRLHKIRGSFVTKVEHNIHKVTEYRQMGDKDLQNIVEGEYEEVDGVPSESEEGTGTEGAVPETP